MHPPILFDEKIPSAQRRPPELWAGSAGAGAGRGGDGAVRRSEDVAFPTTRRRDGPDDASNLVVGAPVGVLCEPYRKTEQVGVRPNDGERERIQERVSECFPVYPMEEIGEPGCDVIPQLIEVLLVPMLLGLPFVCQCIGTECNVLKMG